MNLLQFTLLTENFTVKQCSDVAKFKACFKCKCTFNFFAVVWSVNVEANVLAADPLSPYMAVVDNDQKCKYMYTYKWKKVHLFKAADALREQILAELLWLSCSCPAV